VCAPPPQKTKKPKPKFRMTLPSLARALAAAAATARRGVSNKPLGLASSGAASSASHPPRWWTQPRALHSSSSSGGSRDGDADAKQHLSSLEKKATTTTTTTASTSVGRTLVDIARANPHRIAVVSPKGDSITYGALLSHAEALARALRAAAQGDCRNDDVLRGERVGISATPGPEYVAAMHATWMCGAIAVPIATSHTRDEVEYVLRDAGVKVMATILVEDFRAAAELALSLTTVGVRAVATPPLLQWRGEEEGYGHTVRGGGSSSLDDDDYSAAADNLHESPEEDDGALIIYTSGTTGRPKGVLHTHGTLAAQCSALVSAWGWRRGDGRGLSFAYNRPLTL
jgi:acyl-CoA synthetase (AMP-forming)/AMP-acid ligase II